MPGEKLNCPGGIDSQTGSAGQKRNPNAEIIRATGIIEIQHELQDLSDPTCLPIWNSNEGEIKKTSYIWDFIVQEKIRILDLWAQTIEFWHIRKLNSNVIHRRIGSVAVIRSQCSLYLESNSLIFEERDEYGLSSDAFIAYQNGADLAGVFIAPKEDSELSELDGFEIISKDTVVANNFTSFVKIKHVDQLQPGDIQGENFLTGLVIRPLQTQIGASEAEFFDRIIKQAKDVDDIPRLLFVIKRDEKVGLLFQSQSKMYLDEILDVETLEKEEISIYNEAGSTQQKYIDQLSNLLQTKFPILLSDDFIVHEGIQTCIFICPALGIYTHGFERKIVEPVIRYYISKLFEAIYNSKICTPNQKALFTKHEAAWKLKRSEFIVFKEIT